MTASHSEPRPILAAPSSEPARPSPPTLASPGRQIFHMIIAAAGWVIFGWWWWLVIHSVGREAVQFTVVFVLVTAVVVVALTAGWSFHNLLIFRRRGPRKQVRAAAEVFSHDRLGRGLYFADGLESVRTRPIVQIQLELQGKVYRTTRLGQSGGETRPPNGAPHEPC